MNQQTRTSRMGRGRAAATSVRLAAIAACLAAIAGCAKSGPERTPVHPVKGTITFKGEPMSGALVALHPQSPQEGTPNPRANVGKDGAFDVSTYVTADGAPEGDYVLTVLWYKPVKKGSDIVEGPNVIPAKYANPATSTLRVSVKPGENALPAITL
jgi:hypothetical protein